MHLENYISDLLYTHDCVVVPGFGAFLTRYQAAELDRITHTFYPPKKSIGFNMRLQENDGVLAHHIATDTKSDLKKSEAFVEKEVRNWRLDIAQNKFLSLEKLGDFSVDDQGKWQFVPSANINFLPESFGLSAVVSKPLASKPIKRIVPVQETKTPPTWYKYAAVAAVAVTVGGFLGFNYYNQQVSQYNLAEKQKADKMLQKRIQAATFELNASETPVTIQIVSKTYPYHVIAGAFREEENAHKRIEELIQKGYQARLLGTNKYGLHQVAFQSFSDKSTALEFLQEIRTQVFSEAWMLIENL
jgi:nucleoid DNA-binding protein